MHAPRVSVCILAYNQGKFVSQAIQSALLQSERDIEVVLIDDASTDQTFEVAVSHSDPRFRVERNERRLGENANANRCFEIARGRYLKILDGDDLLFADALRKLADGLDRFPEAVFATSAWNKIDAGGAFVTTVRLAKDDATDGTLIGLPQIVRTSWLFRNHIGNAGAVLLRKNALGYRFDPAYRQVADWVLWLRLLERGPLLYLPQVLSAYRVHFDSITGRQRSIAVTADDLLRLPADLERSRSRGDVARFDVKRLQALCFASAVQRALLCFLRIDRQGLAENLQIAARAIRHFWIPLTAPRTAIGDP